MNFSEFFIAFPEMSKQGLRAFKKTIDSAYRGFSREYGDSIEAVFDPVLYFLVNLEKLILKFIIKNFSLANMVSWTNKTTFFKLIHNSSSSIISYL